ncbi:MAG: HD domain-containing protein [Clostridia bacterium]
MSIVNTKLQQYIETEIFPIYKNNDAGHGICHIKYVIERSLKFASQFKNIDLNMIYTIAAFHDIGHYIDKDNHELISAKIFYENDIIRKFFTDEQSITIKEAIEDHRASLEYEPRSIYGKIVSTADKVTDICILLKRNYFYTIKHYPNFSFEQIIEEAYNYILVKFGRDGYAKLYIVDEDYNKFKREVEELLADKIKFTKKYIEVNEILLDDESKIK